MIVGINNVRPAFTRQIDFVAKAIALGPEFATGHVEGLRVQAS